MTTYLEKPANVKEQWHLVNAEGKTLGRLAAKVAGILRGKHRPTFTPNVDMGDHVVIINAEKIHLTGNKMQDKLYIHHSGYPGGLKTTDAQHLFKKDPTELLVRAIEGMLPKTPRLCRIESSASGATPGTYFSLANWTRRRPVIWQP